MYHTLGVFIIQAFMYLNTKYVILYIIFFSVIKKQYLFHLIFFNLNIFLNLKFIYWFYELSKWSIYCLILILLWYIWKPTLFLFMFIKENIFLYKTKRINLKYIIKFSILFQICFSHRKRYIKNPINSFPI